METTISRQDIQPKLNRLFELCSEINEKTEFAAFLEMSGHTDQIDIRIKAGKKTGQYQIAVAETSFYIDGNLGILKKESPLEFLDAKILALEAILKNPENFKPITKQKTIEYIEEGSTIKL